MSDYNSFIVWCLLIISLIGVVILMNNGGTFNVTPPSEEKCQGYNGNTSTSTLYAERFWCEYNETGWHFNKTHFNESLSSGVAI